MNAAQLLQEMQLRRINVTLTDGRLHLRAPKGALTQELKTALAVHRDVIVAALNFDAQDAVPPISSARHSSTYPLSYSQERLWFLDQFEQNASSYLMPTAVRLIGRFDVSSFQMSIADLVSRHAGLHTVFESVGGEARQRIVAADAVCVPCPVIDLSGVEAQARFGQALALVEEEARKPFDLSRGPLLRALVIDMGETEEPPAVSPRMNSEGRREYIVVFTMHHIISDGWSSDVLVREFAALYEARLSGRDAALPPLPIQYVDYAAWQREVLSGDALERRLAYWREALSGAHFALDLPTDRPRPATQDNAGRTLHFEVPAELGEKLRAFARGQGATLYMILLSAYFIVLSRWSGETDICVGTPVANRRRVEFEGLIGFFVNTLVMRGDLSSDPDFLSFLSRIRAMCLGAQEHQDLPFERLVEALAPTRDPSRTPLFQAMFSLQNAPARRFSLPGLTIEPIAIESGAAKFDLSLELLEEPDGRLLGEIEYATALFNPETIERMIGHYLTVLDSIVTTPDARLSTLNLLTENEREVLVNLGHTQQKTFLHHDVLHQRFAAQVERTPHAVAIVYEGEQLTYDELNRRANQLAHWLVRQGVGPDVIVALCFERSLEMVIGLLAVLKAGGAYLPLDPGLPDERLAIMVADASPKVLITQTQLLEKLTTIVKARKSGSIVPADRIMPIDASASVLDLEPRDNPSRAVGPENLAYLIYTSGSTGRPKAVAVTHANVVRLFAATQEAFNFSESDVWTLFHSYAFDFSVWELWGALLHGGRLVIVPHWVSRSPEAFRKLLADNAVTILNQTPSAFHRLDDVDALSEGLAPLALRLVIFGGEALDQRRLSAWFERHPGARPRFVNMYGITETTVHVTLKDIAIDDARSNSPGTIGWPISDLNAYILDHSLAPAPLGVCGEIFVGGAGLARGYFNRPDLTAERFAPSPFSDAGARLYRTGDLGRYRADGAIEYLGRADQQVKIRGFRIELGEIESALAALAEIRAAVAITRDDGDGDKRLIAYVETENPSAFDINAAKARLRERLPDYMIPVVIHPLGKLPLNQNGKVDRRALPEVSIKAATENYIAPQTILEWMILQAFRETLKIDNIGMNDNFFELGGNSILGLKLVDRVRRSLSKDMFVAAIFRAQTPAALTQFLLDEARADSSSLVPLVASSGRAPILYCMHPAGGSTVRYRALAGRLEGVCGVAGVQSRALLDPDYLPSSIWHMAQEYAEALCTHQPSGPYRLIGWSAGGAIALAVAAKLERMGERVDFVGLLDPTVTAQAHRQTSSALDHLATFAEFHDVTLNLNEKDRRELTKLTDGLDDRGRFIAAGLWGRDLGLWADVSEEILAFLYDDSMAFDRMLASFEVEPINADIHVWWARDADVAVAAGWTRGAIHSVVLDTSHEHIIIDEIAHEQIANVLRTRGDRFQGRDRKGMRSQARFILDA